MAVYPVKTSGNDGHDQSCLQNFRKFGVEGHALTLPKTYLFVNGFRLVYINVRLFDDSAKRKCFLNLYLRPKIVRVAS